MRLVFWNCGVAPPKGTRSVPRAKAAVGIIGDLVRSRPAMIALCEADANLVHDLVTELDLESQGYYQRILDDTIRGGSRWDLAILFDQRQVEVLGDRAIFGSNDGRKLRAGYGLEVLTHSDRLRFELFLAHWPSRQRASESESRRRCAEALWNEIKTRLQDGWRVLPW